MSAEKNKRRNLGLEMFVIFVSVMGLLMLLYLVIILSFQDGDSSASGTMSIAVRISQRIYTNPTEDEIRTVSLMLRYVAHLGLFFVVGFVTTFVSMVIFRRYYGRVSFRRHLLSAGVLYRVL